MKGTITRGPIIMFIASGRVEDRQKIQYFFHQFQPIHKGCFCEPFVFISSFIKQMRVFIFKSFSEKLYITLFSPAWYKVISRLLKFPNSQHPYQANHFFFPKGNSHSFDINTVWKKTPLHKYEIIAHHYFIKPLIQCQSLHLPVSFCVKNISLTNKNAFR